MLIAEGIAAAQKVTGKKVVTGEDVRRGLENINLDAARLQGDRPRRLRGPFKLSCADHNSHSATFVQQWDGAKWVKVSDAIASATDKVQPLIDAAAKAYAEKNAGWPRAPSLRQQVVRPNSPLPQAGEGKAPDEGPLSPPLRGRAHPNKCPPEGQGIAAAPMTPPSSTSQYRGRLQQRRAGAEGRVAQPCARAASSRCSAPMAPARRRP
jgi:hypothetical protein